MKTAVNLTNYRFIERQISILPLHLLNHCKKITKFLDSKELNGKYMLMFNGKLLMINGKTLMINGKMLIVNGKC